MLLSSPPRLAIAFSALSCLPFLACSSSSATPSIDAGGDGSHPQRDAAADHMASAPDALTTDASDGAADTSSSHDALVDARGTDGSTVDAPRHADAGADAVSASDAAKDGASDAAKDGASDAAKDAASDVMPDTGAPALAYVGRIDYGDPTGPRFEWPGTEVIARFTGTTIDLQMTDYGNYFNVIVDGTLQTNPIIGAGGTSEYPLASGLSAGTHEVIVHRRTEADVSTTQILGVTFPQGGSLLPPRAPSSRRIEVLGDSISCGLGALGVGPTCDATNANEDHYVTYGAVAARTLGADLITTAWSGEGGFQNYDDSTAEPPLPGLYPYTLPNEPSTATLWSFQGFTPDAVVINLGTNDFWNGDPGTGYETAYVTLLTTIRTNYPHAYILCANGPLLLNPDFTTAQTYIQDAIATRNAAGDQNLGYLSFGIQSGMLGYGCDYHPDVATHAQMGATLASALQTALGW